MRARTELCGRVRRAAGPAAQGATVGYARDEATPCGPLRGRPKKHSEPPL